MKLFSNGHYFATTEQCNYLFFCKNKIIIIIRSVVMATAQDIFTECKLVLEVSPTWKVDGKTIHLSHL